MKKYLVGMFGLIGLVACGHDPSMMGVGGATTSSTTLSVVSSSESTTQSSTVTNTVGTSNASSAVSSSGVVVETTDDCSFIQTQNDKCQQQPPEGQLYVQTAVYAFERNGTTLKATNSSLCVGSPPVLPNVLGQNVIIMQPDAGATLNQSYDYTGKTVTAQQAETLRTQINVNPAVSDSDCVAYVGSITGNKDQYGATSNNDPTTTQWFFCIGNCANSGIVQCTYVTPTLVPNTMCRH